MFQNLLPCVNAEVGFSIAQSLGDADEITYQRELSKIKKDNPTIAEFIQRWSDDDVVAEQHKFQVALCGILVYKMLFSQAESDKMCCEFKFVN